MEECQTNIIADLVYPRQTILDESLGTAFWFAARGHQSSCRVNLRHRTVKVYKLFPKNSFLFFLLSLQVLLLGSGADELFGGYTRHRNAFKRQGWSGLSRELQLDWKRISFRNLARDNRVICDHGRQPRMPYLDEEFTDYVLNLKPWLKLVSS